MAGVPSSSNPSLAVQLPTGGELVGFRNPHPQLSDCCAILSLQTQVAPLIASMVCQIKVLKLLRPLIEIVKGLPNPSVAALEEFEVAATELVPCLSMATPAVVVPFVRDLLCLEIKSLKCFSNELQGVVGKTGAGLNLPAQAEARGVLDSYPAIVWTLTLAGELFQIAGVPPPQAPVLNDKTDAASLEADLAAVAAFTTELQLVANALGGCS